MSGADRADETGRCDEEAGGPEECALEGVEPRVLADRPRVPRHRAPLRGFERQLVDDHDERTAGEPPLGAQNIVGVARQPQLGSGPSRVGQRQRTRHPGQLRVDEQHDPRVVAQ